MQKLVPVVECCHSRNLKYVVLIWGADDSRKEVLADILENSEDIVGETWKNMTGELLKGSEKWPPVLCLCNQLVKMLPQVI